MKIHKSVIFPTTMGQQRKKPREQKKCQVFEKKKQIKEIIKRKLKKIRKENKKQKKKSGTETII